MYKKFIKQKLLSRRPWIVAVTAVVVLSTFSSFFGLSTPATPYLEQLGLNSTPPKAAAQSVDQRAEAWCNNSRNRIIDKEACKNGYRGGFRGDSGNIAACGSGEGRGADRDYTDCAKAFLAGRDDRGAPPSGQPPENTGALTGACLAYNGDAREACNEGFVAGYEERTLEVCLGLQREACMRGYAAGQNKKSADQAGGEERRAAREACDDGANQLAKDACATGYLAALNGRSKEEACGQANDQRACKAGYDRGKPDADGNELTDCTATSNPLSWIICPIINLGAGLSDSVFQDIVKPLLSDVPVSTKPRDPIYIVWQNFRLLANLMLVGSMLLIVYAQTRGGDK